MSQGKPSEVQLKFSPKEDEQTPTLLVQDVAGPAGSRSSRTHTVGDVRFKRWGEAADFREWKYRGVVYAELINSAKQTPKLIVVQAGDPKQGTFGKMKSWAKKKLGINGKNQADPRLILEMEDRDGADLCMWLYHVCCAMGGELKRDLKATDLARKDEMCPAGTICCPGGSEKTEGDATLSFNGDDGYTDGGASWKKVPWHKNTLELLRVLAHGKLSHAPQLEQNDPAQGWKDRDPISGTGPAQCHQSLDVFERVWPDGEGSHVVGSRTQDRKRKDRKEKKKIAKFEVCVFNCYEPARKFYKSKKICEDRNGEPLQVRTNRIDADTGDNDFKPVKKGNCHSRIPGRSTDAEKWAHGACMAKNSKCSKAVFKGAELELSSLEHGERVRRSGIHESELKGSRITKSRNNAIKHGELTSGSPGVPPRLDIPTF